LNFQSKEALESSIGLCTHVSCRMAAKQIERIQNHLISHTPFTAPFFIYW